MHIEKISTVAPVLAAVVIAACVGVSLASYTPNVYAVTAKRGCRTEKSEWRYGAGDDTDAQVF